MFRVPLVPEGGLFQAPLMITQTADHIGHPGLAVGLTEPGSGTTGTKRGLLQAPLVFTLSVHQVASFLFTVCLACTSAPIGPKNGPASAPFVDTQGVHTVVHIRRPVLSTIHRTAPVPKDGSGRAPKFSAVASTRVPLALWSARPGASGVRARVAHVTLTARILRPTSTNEDHRTQQRLITFAAPNSDS